MVLAGTGTTILVTVGVGVGVAVTVSVTCTVGAAAGTWARVLPHAASPPIRASAPSPGTTLMVLMLISPSDPAGAAQAWVLPGDRRPAGLWSAISDCTRPLCSTFIMSAVINR